MGKGRKKPNTQLGLKAANAKKELFIDLDKLTNTSFNEYYSRQEILEEDEFLKFTNILKTPLPISFRLTGSRLHALDLKEYMKTKIFSKIENLVIDELPVNKPVALDWYPNQLAWMIDIPKTVMRRSPLLKQFQNFLVSETQIGNISRQEAVSMIPPLVLDAKPGHYVLDMCAAPGSKTAQLLESVMESEKFPDGLVIANDSDQKRAYMLVHQGKRLQTPCLMVTNHAAQEFPKIWMDHDSENPYYLQFDRVLADVPCSGDGTLRKNKTIFATWNVNVANSLHSVQLSILNRGCELLKVGGRLVYSTCSFNPIENEAVVAAMLNKGEGAFRLVDVSSKLKELKRKPGLTKWVVRKNGKFYDEFLEDQELHQSMFPPKNAETLGLEKCIRVYPHLQNYGGFFVAVFEKTAEYGTLHRGKPPKNKKRYYYILNLEQFKLLMMKLNLFKLRIRMKKSLWKKLLKRLPNHLVGLVAKNCHFYFLKVMMI